MAYNEDILVKINLRPLFRKMIEKNEKYDLEVLQKFVLNDSMLDVIEGEGKLFITI